MKQDLSCPLPPPALPFNTQYTKRLKIKAVFRSRSQSRSRPLIIIVEIIFGVKKIKMFILVDPSCGLVRVYCLYVCMFVFCFAEPEPEPFYFWRVEARAEAAGNRAAPKLWIKARRKRIRDTHRHKPCSLHASITGRSPPDLHLTKSTCSKSTYHQHPKGDLN